MERFKDENHSSLSGYFYDLHSNMERFKENTDDCGII